MPPKKASKKQGSGISDLPFKQINYILFGVALALIVLGFIVMESGDITISPLLLVLGYCVFLPLSLMWPGKESVTGVQEYLESETFEKKVGG